MEKQYETPECNIKLAALRLLRHKALVKLAQDRTYLLDIEDVNEILTVANLPVIMPAEINTKEINVIKLDKEDEA